MAKATELTDKDLKTIADALKTHHAMQKRAYNTAANALIKDIWDKLLTETAALQAKM